MPLEGAFLFLFERMFKCEIKMKTILKYFVSVLCFRLFVNECFENRKQSEKDNGLTNKASLVY